MRLSPLLLCIFLTAACGAKQVADVRFTASDYETVLERTVRALERYGNGIHQVDASRGRVLTKWKDAGVTVGRTLVFYRLLATVAPAGGPSASGTGGSQADVRLSVQTVQCSLLDAQDLERLASECAEAETVPEKVQENFRRAAKSFELEVSRGG